MSNQDKNPLELEERIIAALRTVYDPEIPVNVYDLGLIYDVDVDHDTGIVNITMTLTSRLPLRGSGDEGQGGQGDQGGPYRDHL